MPSRKVSWVLAIPVEVECEYTGIPQGDYYTSLEKAIEVSERFPPLFEKATGYRPPLSYNAPVTAYEGVAALGGSLTFPRDHQPQILNQANILADPAQVDSLAVPDPMKSPRFQKLLGWYKELVRRFDGKVGTGLAGQEGPVTTAVLLRGERFFMDLLDDPRRAHRLLETVTGMFILWTRTAREITGVKTDTVGIADDHSGLIGPDLWPEFVLPYYEKICAALGPRCWMHTELVRPRHLKLFRRLDLAAMNFSEDQYLTPEDMMRELPGVPFGWHILTVSEMQQGTPDSIGRRYRELAAKGIREIRCEITVNTPPRNIRAFLETARELEG